MARIIDNDGRDIWLNPPDFLLDKRAGDDLVRIADRERDGGFQSCKCPKAEIVFRVLSETVNLDRARGGKIEGIGFANLGVAQWARADAEQRSNIRFQDGARGEPPGGRKEDQAVDLLRRFQRKPRCDQPAERIAGDDHCLAQALRDR